MCDKLDIKKRWHTIVEKNSEEKVISMNKVSFIIQEARLVKIIKNFGDLIPFH